MCNYVNVKVIVIPINAIAKNLTLVVEVNTIVGPRLLLIEVTGKNFKFTSNFTSDPIG